MVDEAKAFCPACGNAFVDEERRSISTNFEEMDSTVQLGQTMYNQMLSDMGLNISKSPQPDPHHVEVLAPQAPAANPTPPPIRDGSPKSGTLKWILIGAAIAILLALIVVVAAVAIVYWMRPTVT